MNIKNAFKEFIFEEDRDFKSCHASTLIKLKNEVIVAAWFGGSAEGKTDVSIWLSRRIGKTWERPISICDRMDIVHWNPVLFLDKEDVIHLFYKIGHPISCWKTMHTTSFDFGQSWAVPSELVEGDLGGRGPVKNKPIYLSNGEIICPASLENGSWDAFCDLTSDNFKTLRMSNFVPILHQANENDDETEKDNPNYCHGKGIIQPTLWESVKGKTHMLLRSSGAKIFRSDSEDYGKTWCAAYDSGLPNNNSGIDLVKHEKSGAVFLVYNPVRAYKGVRTPLNLAVSFDNGNSFSDILTLENSREGHYSYPAIICHDDTLYITYTWVRERIAFWEIELCDFIGGK